MELRNQWQITLFLDDSTVDLVDVSSAFDDYKLLHQNMTADFGEVTIAFDDYESNYRFWWCNISLWWQHNTLDFGDVTLAFVD